MSIFARTMQKIDASNPQEAIKKMANHIRYIQEQLEYTLLNLDSSNITEIDTQKTIIDSSNSISSVGEYINLKGKNGEIFTVGNNAAGAFEFSIKGKNGEQEIYLDKDTGMLVITKYANLTVDGGEW